MKISKSSTTVKTSSQPATQPTSVKKENGKVERHKKDPKAVPTGRRVHKPM